MADDNKNKTPNSQNPNVPNQVYPPLDPNRPQGPPGMMPPPHGQPQQPPQHIPQHPMSPGYYGPPYNPGGGYSQPMPPPGYSPPQGYGPYPQPPPGYHHPPIVNQPGAMGTGQEGQWMALPHSIPNCPPGLEYLTVIDELMVKQKIELTEVLTDFESKNKFSIKNKNGQKVYFAAEDSGYCARNCLGSYRPFQMKVFDNRSKEVIHIKRPCACDSCCFPCCLQTMEIYSPPGVLIGRIEQEWSFIIPRFVIKDPSGEVVLRIEGPCCTTNLCCGEVEFKILSIDGKIQVGRIAKHWSGLVQEIGTDAENFGISFPLDLDVKMKAVLIGACFLIDIVYYEAASTGPIKLLSCFCACICTNCKSKS